MTSYSIFLLIATFLFHLSIDSQVNGEQLNPAGLNVCESLKIQSYYGQQTRSRTAYRATYFCCKSGSQGGCDQYCYRSGSYPTYYSTPQIFYRQVMQYSCCEGFQQVGNECPDPITSVGSGSGGSGSGGSDSGGSGSGGSGSGGSGSGGSGSGGSGSGGSGSGGSGGAAGGASSVNTTVSGNATVSNTTVSGNATVSNATVSNTTVSNTTVSGNVTIAARASVSGNEPKNAYDKDFDVTCDDTHMVVWFNKTALDERDKGHINNRTWQIYFEGKRGDDICSTYIWDSSKTASTYENMNKTEFFTSTVLLGAPINNCGINRFADATHIIYNATVIVTYGENPNDFIRREEYDKYNVMCLRNRTVVEESTLSIQYRQTGNDGKNATEDFTFTFGHTDMSDTPQSLYKVGQYIKFTMTSLTVRSEVKAVIQRCWTTNGDGSTNPYYLIQNRCNLEGGTSWVSLPSDTVSTFKTEAFRYLTSGATSNIHAQCLVRVCLDTQSNECTLCTPSINLKRREAVEDSTDTNLGEMVLVKTKNFKLFEQELSPEQQEASHVLSGTNGLLVIVGLAIFVVTVSMVIVKKVFINCKTNSVAESVDSRSSDEVDA
eukprot:TCONS_00029228-protein